MCHKKYGLDRKDIMKLMEKVDKKTKGPDEKEPKKFSISEAKRKLAAFILQGKEACFIHSLTLLCNLNSIKVMKNEHDGIITNKIIPKALVVSAAIRAKLPGAVLDQKDLAGEEDILKAGRLIGKKIK